jgi:hypothetical protein
MATATKTTTQTNVRSNSVNFDGVRIAVPVYIGVEAATAKAIISALRAKCASGAAPTVTASGIQVQHSGETLEERQLVERLRIDLHTLRTLLLGSDTRGLALDLALRVQAEIADTIVFVTVEQVRAAFEHALQHYQFYGPKES